MEWILILLRCYGTYERKMEKGRAGIRIEMFGEWKVGRRNGK
jgi:hypothetical protein